MRTDVWLLPTSDSRRKSPLVANIGILSGKIKVFQSHFPRLRDRLFALHRVTQQFLITLWI
jgi:hypothetical protein